MPMKRHLSFLALLVLLLAACASKPAASAEAGPPPSGSWSGDFGPDAERRESVRLDLNWEGKNLRGVVHSGVRDLEISKAFFNPETGAITLEFDAQGNGGQIVHYVIDGKVAGNTMAGSWVHDTQRGDFKVTKR